MERLHNGFTLELSDSAFPLSTDSIALSAFAKLPKNARVLDLGSGCGTLGLLLCSRYEDCSVTGIELDPDAHEMALHNARSNGISSRLNSICEDFTHLPTFIKPGSFQCCISNPPYFSAGPASQSVPLARSEQAMTMETLFASASWALKYGGDFFLVHRPERLGEICAVAGRHQLEAKRLCLLRHRSNSPVSLILLQLRKGGKPGLILEEECLYDAAGIPTDYYKKLYHT